MLVGNARSFTRSRHDGAIHCAAGVELADEVHDMKRPQSEQSPDLCAGKLCSLCVDLTLEKLREQCESTQPSSSRSIRHHPSFSSLERSVATGCQLCILFHGALLGEYTTCCGWTVTEVEQYHHELDRQDPHQRHIFGVEITYLHDLDTRSGAHLDRYDGLCYARHTHLRDDGSIGMYSTSDVVMPNAPNLYPWLSLTTCNGPTRNVIGRSIPVQPDLELCSGWIEACSAKHEACRPVADLPMPTRVIDVGTLEVQPRLVVTDGRSGKYVALSHCWGPIQPLCTTAQNYKNHLCCIQFAGLPLTFRHAVLVTRQLGFRYLWIDTLCIRQGDQEDWQRECSRMDQNFENAAMVIAGPAATSSSSGFLFSRRPADLPPCVMPGCLNQEVLVRMSDVPSPQEQRHLPKEKSSPLATRGWALQERLLAQRVLYFGSRQLYFECKSGQNFESCWRPLLGRKYAGDLLSKSELTFDHHAVDDRWHWYQTVAGYTKCHLTVATDKLPALSGLAKRAARQFQDIYHAGLWEKDMFRCLQWVLAQPAPGRLTRYRAPSWSWACINEPVEYDVLTLTRSLPIKPLATVVKAATQQSGLDDYGEVSSGSVQIEGRLAPFTVVQERENCHVGRGSATAFMSGHGIGEFFPDYADWVETMAMGADRVFFLPMQVNTSSTINGAFGYSGLVLERLALDAPTSVYRRMGYIYARGVKNGKHCWTDCPQSAEEHQPSWEVYPVHMIFVI